MKRLIFSLILIFSIAGCNGRKTEPTGAEDRQVWVEAMVKIADPVLSNLAAGTLKQNMPYECRDEKSKRQAVSYLEAFGRTMCGIGPWLQLGGDDTPEGKLREKYIDMAVKAVANAVDPASPDYMVFDKMSQPLVDAAFLAEGLLRAPSIWEKFSDKVRQDLVRELKASRAIKPGESNWLLFASTVEAALLEFTGEYDEERMMYGIRRFRDEWYKGDAWYGDGKMFHFDYYNSLVLHPMLTDVLQVMNRHGIEDEGFLEVQLKRHGRLGQQLERLISPEGAYPVVGRSITYRFGSFHAMSSAALLHILPEEVEPAQVRCALTAVIKRQLSLPGTFDENGWLTVGFTSDQVHMSESYINTGSEYLVCAGFCALGLPPTDPFWSNPYTPWTAIKAWSGIDMEADHALGN